MDHQLIALVGSMGHGKDTCADFLVDEYKYVKLSHAMPIKRGLCAMFDLSYETLEKSKRKDDMLQVCGLNLHVRSLYQTLGTEWGRDMVSADLWVACMRKAILELFDQADGQEETARVVVADTRFRNEFDSLLQLGAVTVYIHNDRVSSKTAKTAHSSETSISELAPLCKYRVDNNSDLETLYTHMAAIVHKEYGKL